MLAHIVSRSLIRRRRRKLLTLVAVTLGIAVTTAVATIALDVGDRVGRELRSFGANIALTPAADGIPITVGGVDFRPAGAGAFLAEDDLVKLKKIFWRNNIMAFAPYLYLPGNVGGRKVVLVGSWFDKQLVVDKSESVRTGLKSLHQTWRVRGDWPGDDDPSACLVGQRLAAALGVKPGATVEFAAEDAPDGSTPRKTLDLSVRGILESGGGEDDQIIVPLATVQALAGMEGKYRRAEISALTKPEDDFARSDVTQLSPEEFDRWYCTPYVSAISYQIEQAIPGAEARPVYRVAETEGRILDRVGILMALLAAGALISSALAVASMMLATVLERRSEIGLYKSLGATNPRVAAIFLLEALAVGLLGGVAGFFGGSLMARHLGALIFGLPAAMHWVIFPGAVALALLVTLAGSAYPLARGLRLAPAAVLHDE
jgi:putative ABC transport system permease protein